VPAVHPWISVPPLFLEQNSYPVLQTLQFLYSHLIYLYTVYKHITPPITKKVQFPCMNQRRLLIFKSRPHCITDCKYNELCMCVCVCFVVKFLYSTYCMKNLLYNFIYLSIYLSIYVHHIICFQCQQFFKINFIGFFLLYFVSILDKAPRTVQI